MRVGARGYDGIYLESEGQIIEVGCWAHARRKYHEAWQLDPPRMETALAWIGKLYAIEKNLRERRKTEWQELPFEEQAAHIAAERQSRSLPLPAMLPDASDEDLLALLPHRWRPA